MNRPRRIASVLSVVLALLVTTTPAASAWAPQGGPVFNNPRGNSAAKFRILKSVTRAIQHAPRGSRIMISSYMFDAGGAYDALMAAHRRGVRVQMVLDGTNARNGMTTRLARRFNRDNVRGAAPVKWGRDRSFVVFCAKACRGAGGFNHSKFYAFSQTGTARNVVMVSSSNLNRGGALLGWNDMFVMKGAPRLLQRVAGVHAEMAEDSANDGDRFVQFRERNALARFFPKRTGTHPVLTDLGRVRCKGAAGGAGSKGRTVIRVSMFRWNRASGMAIARRLVKLAGNGCTVKIIYGAPSRELRLYLTKAARRSPRLTLWDSRLDRNRDGTYDLRVHHKYLLISGVYGSDRSAWMVTTGSQNWGASLRTSDENTLTISSRGAHGAYVGNWRRVVAHSARRIG